MGRNGEMSTDLKILRTELSAQASTLLIFLIVSAAVLAMSLVVGMGTMIVPMAMITVAFLPMPMFARDDKGRMNTMYVILPVSRTRRVLARYLLLLGAAIVMTLAGLAVSVLIDPYATRYPYFDRPAMASLMGLAFAFMCFVTGVQLPLAVQLRLPQGRDVRGVHPYPDRLRWILVVAAVSPLDLDPAETDQRFLHRAAGFGPRHRLDGPLGRDLHLSVRPPRPVTSRQHKDLRLIEYSLHPWPLAVAKQKISITYKMRSISKISATTAHIRRPRQDRRLRRNGRRPQKASMKAHTPGLFHLGRRPVLVRDDCRQYRSATDVSG